VEIFFSSAGMQKTLRDRVYFLILKIPEWFFCSVVLVEREFFITDSESSFPISSNDINPGSLLLS
jgi:hypothetical protein